MSSTHECNLQRPQMQSLVTFERSDTFLEAPFCQLFNYKSIRHVINQRGLSTTACENGGQTHGHVPSK